MYILAQGQISPQNQAQLQEHGQVQQHIIHTMYTNWTKNKSINDTKYTIIKNYPKDDLDSKGDATEAAAAEAARVAEKDRQDWKAWELKLGFLLNKSISKAIPDILINKPNKKIQSFWFFLIIDAKIVRINSISPKLSAKL